MDLNRTAALRGALDLHIAAERLLGGTRVVGMGARQATARDEMAILRTAETFLAWLNGPTSIHLHAGPVRDQVTGLPPGAPTPKGPTMQLHDNEQFDLSADTKDAKGFETVDTLTWSIDDETVATLAVSDDTKTCTVVAGNPGSAVITVTDGDRSVTEAIDVVAGDTALITLAEGAVTTQPDATTPPAGDGGDTPPVDSGDTTGE